MASSTWRRRAPRCPTSRTTFSSILPASPKLPGSLRSSRVRRGALRLRPDHLERTGSRQRRNAVSRNRRSTRTKQNDGGNRWSRAGSACRPEGRPVTNFGDVAGISENVSGWVVVAVTTTSHVSGNWRGSDIPAAFAGSSSASIGMPPLTHTHSPGHFRATDPWPGNVP